MKIQKNKWLFFQMLLGFCIAAILLFAFIDSKKYKKTCNINSGIKNIDVFSLVSFKFSAFMSEIK